MSELCKLTIAEARDGLKEKKFSALELTQAHLDTMTAKQDLNAFIVETPDAALAQAKASDEKIAQNKAGALEGIPLAIKDLYCTEGVQTTAASKILEGFIPQYESTVTSNLKTDGAVFLGKANLDQFAMGSSNTTSAFGNVINPWKRADGVDLTPGGSSGGSAAAVSARMAMGATGTDTAGSIRQPAAFTGLVGMKPTYGRCSRWGVIAFASSLDTMGPMTRTVKDAAIMLESMASYDAKDSTSVDLPVPNYEALIGKDIKGLKIGIPKEYTMDGMPADIAELWQKGADWLKAQGAEIIDVSLPHTKYALPAYYVISPAEASSNLARYDGVRYGMRVCDEGDSLDDMYEKTRAAGFGDEVKRRMIIGTYVLSAGYYDAYYLKALKVRRLVRNDFDAAFKKVDMLLAPVAPSTAFGLNEKQDDPVSMYLNDVFTITANMAGLPAISVPCGLAKDGLPLGLQLIGKDFAEADVLNAAARLEEAASFTATPTL
ncbi:MAG: Asp-tRNA(Asn)/Glu-tRNA(Gln) amidotransferase subunit GatA [Alphaproteobacteria bacterium]